MGTPPLIWVMITAWPYACKAAMGTVRYQVKRLSLARPCSPSSCNACNWGMMGVSNWMIIWAVM